MTDTASSGATADIVAAADPERFLAAAYAPKRARAGLMALFALDISMGRVVQTTNEPMIGAMRLAWWREALERLHRPPVPGEPVLQALAVEVVRDSAELGAEAAGLADGWLALIEVEALDTATLQTHARERGGRLFGLAARVLTSGVQGVRDDPGGVRRLGEGWALVDLASHLTQEKARDEALSMAAEALRPPVPAPDGVRPLVALAALARWDARRGLKGRRIGSPRRQLRMLAALLTGR